MLIIITCILFITKPSERNTDMFKNTNLESLKTVPQFSILLTKATHFVSKPLGHNELKFINRTLDGVTRPKGKWRPYGKGTTVSAVFFFLLTIFDPLYSLLGELDNWHLWVAPVWFAVVNEVSLWLCEDGEVDLLAVAKGICVGVVDQHAAEVHSRWTAA